MKNEYESTKSNAVGCALVAVGGLESQGDYPLLVGFIFHGILPYMPPPRPERSVDRDGIDVSRRRQSNFHKP